MRQKLIIELNRPDLYELMVQYKSNALTIEMQIARSLDLVPVLLRIYTKIGWHDMKNSGHGTKEQLDELQIPRHKFSKVMTNVYAQAVECAIQDKLFLN